MKNLILAAILGGIIALVGIKIIDTSPEIKPTAQTQSAFDRVVATRTLRCAYAAYDPFLIIGEHKKITGIFHDAVEEAAKRLDLKVEWVEEVGYGNINTGFATGRYDAFCAGLWPAGTRAANTIFSRAVAWDPVGVWTRGDETRFHDLQALNDPAYKVSVIEGDATVSMANALFPKAGRATISQNQAIGEGTLQVTTGKADAVLHDYLYADRFLQHSPGSIKNLSPDKPALIYALTVGFDAHEAELKNMFDVVLGDMDRDGSIGRIVKTYLGDKSNLLFYQQNQFNPY